MKIVLVVGAYYPYFSATGNCMAKIANEFSINNEVIVISEKKKVNEKKVDKWNDQSLYRVDTKRVNRRLKLLESNSKYKLIAHKVYWFIKFLFTSGGLDLSIADAYETQLEELYNHEVFDIVIPCCMPIEAIYASFLFCKKRESVALYPIMFDLYSGSDIFFRNNVIKAIKQKKAVSLEKMIFERCDHIFYVDNWREYFSNSIYDATLIEHPLIVNEKHSPITLKCKTKINLIYQGEVSYEIRNPEKALSILLNILDMDRENILSFHVFSFGNAYKEFEKSNRNQTRIILYGKVPKEMADGYAEDADVNVVFANSNSDIIPSKIYECISSGKPVIYFTSNASDMPTRILSNYQNSYIFDVNKVEAGTELLTWIYENYQRRIDFNSLPEVYAKSTPQYITQQMMKIISNDK